MNAPLHHSLSLYFGEQQNTLILQTLEQNSIFHTQAGKTSFFAEVTVPWCIASCTPPKRSVAQVLSCCSFAPSTFFIFAFVLIPECGGGPSPLPAPEEMKNIPTVISIMAVALERLIRRRGEKKPGVPRGGSDWWWAEVNVTSQSSLNKAKTKQALACAGEKEKLSGQNGFI